MCLFSSTCEALWFVNIMLAHSFMLKLITGIQGVHSGFNFNSAF